MDVTSAPEQAGSNSNISGGSAISMEDVYDTISSQKDVPAVPEEADMDSPKRAHVPFIKSGGLRDTLQNADRTQRIGSPRQKQRSKLVIKLSWLNMF